MSSRICSNHFIRPFAYSHFQGSLFFQMKICIPTIPAALQAFYRFFSGCICRTQILRPYISIFIWDFEIFSVSHHIFHPLFQTFFLPFKLLVFIFRKYHIFKKKTGTTRIPASFTLVFISSDFLFF